jgi:hypothetical protein
VELEILFVGLATGFAAGIGAATWWGMRAARAERREEERRPGGEARFGLLAWTGNTITARGTAREVVPAVTVEGAPATEREPDTKRSGR